MLSFIHRELLPAVVECSKEPHRNSLLRAMRTGKKNIAEARQADLFRLVDAGESIPKDGINVDAAAMLTYVRPLDAAPAEAAPQQQSEAGQFGSCSHICRTNHGIADGIESWRRRIGGDRMCAQARMTETWKDERWLCARAPAILYLF